MKRDITDYLEDIRGECDYLTKRIIGLDYQEFIQNDDLTMEPGADKIMI